MSCFPVRATQLLSGRSIPKEAEDTHEKVVTIVMCDHLTADARFRELVDVYSVDPIILPEDYWAAAFEALVIRHYDSGEKLLHEMRKDFAGSTKLDEILLSLYPILFIAFLKAARWAFTKVTVMNDVFENELPPTFAKMLVTFAGVDAPKNLQSSSWVQGQFSTALVEYLPKTAGTDQPTTKARERVVLLLGGFASVITSTKVSDYARPIFDQLTHRLLNLMPMAERMHMFSERFPIEAA